VLVLLVGDADCELLTSAMNPCHLPCWLPIICTLLLLIFCNSKVFRDVQRCCQCRRDREETQNELMERLAQGEPEDVNTVTGGWSSGTYNRP
jgi:nicotinamide riboside kinase